MSFDLRSIIVYIFGLFLFFMCIKLFKKPLIWIFRLMISCIIGIGILLLFNLIFQKAGFTLALNPFNAVTIGVLGVSGACFAMRVVMFSIAAVLR